MTITPDEDISGGGDRHQLDLNGLDLIAGVGPEGWLLEALADETTWGNPEAIVTEVMSQLLDGSLASVDSYDNREAIINLAISGADGNALAAGEAALIAAARGVDGRGLLTWTPPAAGAESAVFEVVLARLDRTPMNDMLERDDVQGGPERQWTLTLECKPFARSAEPILVEGLPVPTTGAVVPISDGSTLTGWSTTNTQRVLHNLIPNPDFELSTATWAPGAGTRSLSQSPSSYAGGTYCLQVAPIGTGRAHANSALMPLPAGTAVGSSWTVQSGMRVNVTGGGSSSRVGIKVRFFDATGTMIGGDLLPVNTTIPVNTWRILSGQVTVPANAVSVQIFPYADFPTGASVWRLYLDGVIVTEYTPARPGDPYFSGDRADTSVITYSWDGTPRESPSTATYLAPVLSSDGSEVSNVSYGFVNFSLQLDTGFTPTVDSPYLRVSGTASWDVAEPRTDQIAMAFSIDEGTVTPDLLKMSNGTWQAVFYLDPSSGPRSRFYVRAAVPNAAFDVGGTISVDNVELAGSMSDSTGRQTFRTFPVYGAMRTEADVTVISGTVAPDTGAVTPSPLGDDALVYTVPTTPGVSAPNLRQWRTGGTGPIVSAASTITGLAELLATTQAGAVTFEVPADQIRKGTHALYASLGVTSASTQKIMWTATVATAYTSHTETGEVLLATAPNVSGNYRIYPLGHVTLPPADVGPAADATVTIKIWDATSTGNVYLDEAWAFNVDEGQVSLIDTTGGVSMVELTSATIDYPNPACWIGDADTDINTIHAGTRAVFDQHRFPPGDVSVFTVASSSQKVITSLSYYPRWHTHPSTVVLEGGEETEDLDDGEAA